MVQLWVKPVRPIEGEWEVTDVELSEGSKPYIYFADVASLPIGTKFYSHPDPEAAQLRMRVKELEAKLEMAEACLAGDNVLIAGLKNDLAERDQMVVAAVEEIGVRARKSGYLEAELGEYIRSGEWKKHIKKGVE